MSSSDTKLNVCISNLEIQTLDSVLLYLLFHTYLSIYESLK